MLLMLTLVAFAGIYLRGAAGFSRLLIQTSVASGTSRGGHDLSSRRPLIRRKYETGFMLSS